MERAEHRPTSDEYLQVVADIKTEWECRSCQTVNLEDGNREGETVECHSCGAFFVIGFLNK